MYSASHCTQVAVKQHNFFRETLKALQLFQIGDKIFVAGQIAMIPASLAIIPGGILGETRLSLRHVRRILEGMESGSALHDLILVICYVTNQEHIIVAATEWKKTLESCRVSTSCVIKIYRNITS